MQCLECYQKLLDEAEAKENEELGLSGPGGEAGLPARRKFAAVNFHAQPHHGYVQMTSGS